MNATVTEVLASTDAPSDGVVDETAGAATQFPCPSHTVPPLSVHAVPRVEFVLLGTPMEQVSEVHWRLSDGMSVSRVIDFVPPAPLHWTCWQSPTVWAWVMKLSAW